MPAIDRATSSGSAAPPVSGNSSTSAAARLGSKRFLQEVLKDIVKTLMFIDEKRMARIGEHLDGGVHALPLQGSGLPVQAGRDHVQHRLARLVERRAPERPRIGNPEQAYPHIGRRAQRLGG